MKKLACEMCGSTDIIKQDGFFVCQYCGCKYTLEEAKKMFIEGSVKIDKSDDIDNFKQKMQSMYEMHNFDELYKCSQETLDLYNSNAYA